MMFTRAAICLGGLAALVLAACETTPDREVMTSAEQRAARLATTADSEAAPPEPVDGADYGSFILSKLRYRVPNGRIVVKADLSPGKCAIRDVPSGGFPSSARRRLIKLDEFNDAFFDTMRDVGFTVYGDTDRLFEKGPEYQSARYLIAGEIVDYFGKYCFDYHWYTGKPSQALSGSHAVVVRWHVYDRQARETVLKLETKGESALEDAAPEGASILWERSIAAATGRLAADRRFRDAIRVARAPAPRPALALAPLRLTTAALFAGPIADNMDAVRLATLTVDGGEGHGSGFVISADGHVLTNYHVVGESRFVSAELVSGRRVLGEVLRRDKARDVALIRLEGRGYVGLPLRNGEPAKIGEPVFAVGTPLDQSLKSTVTGGIVSAYRDDFGRRLIQADIEIYGGNSGGPLVDARGNVVAIAVAGLASAQAGVGVGINFFIPIQAALRALRIELAPPP